MSRLQPPGCSARMTLQLVGPSSWSEVPALFGYRSDDPFAVHVRFGTVGGAPLDEQATDPDADPDADQGVEWLVGRDLLQAALSHPAGEGDVRLWPAHPPADVLYLELRAPSGHALFELSRAAVAAFLRRTALLVPFGTETSQLEVDDELAALLSGGGEPTGR